MPSAILSPSDSQNSTALSRRVVLFDELRGFMILSMVLYHLCYDLFVIFRVSADWYFDLPGIIWQQSICNTFIFISGACCYFSKNNLRRGGRLFAWALVFSGVTFFVMPEMFIAFGLLHFMGISILLFYPLRRLLEKIPVSIGLLVFFLLFLFTKHVPNHYLGLAVATGHSHLQPILSVRLPDALYSSSFLFPLGLPSDSFYSSDYFPLIPYFFLFLAGSFIGRCSNRFPSWMYQPHVPGLAFLGKNSLWIYLFHQPIVYGFLWLLFQFAR